MTWIYQLKMQTSCVHKLQKHILCCKCHNHFVLYAVCSVYIVLKLMLPKMAKSRAARAVCEEMFSFLATMLKYTALRFCQTKAPEQTTLWAKDQHTISKINTAVYIAQLYLNI